MLAQYVYTMALGHRLGNKQKQQHHHQQYNTVQQLLSGAAKKFARINKLFSLNGAAKANTGMIV